MANGLVLKPAVQQLRHFMSGRDVTQIATYSSGVDVHTVVTYDREYLRGYVNGTLIVEVAETDKEVTHYDNNIFEIGGHTKSKQRYGFVGSLYYLRLYNRSLTAEEVAGHWAGAVEGFQYRQLV